MHSALPIGGLLAALCFSSFLPADVAALPLTQAPATADSSLVLLVPGVTQDHPVLRTATVYPMASRTVAVLSREALAAASRAGLVARVFPGNPMAGEWYLAKVSRPELAPGSGLQAAFADGPFQLFRVQPEQGALVTARGAQAVRLIALPQLPSAEPSPTRVDDAALEAILDTVSVESWSQFDQELSGDSTFTLGAVPRHIASRHTQSEDNTLAGDYLADRLEAMGYEVSFQYFNYSGDIERNVVATLKGTTRPNDIYVLGGHYDSTAGSANVDNAPGADDNASGTSLVLEAARVLAGQRFDATVQFVLFGVEEQGLIGSQEYVKQLKSSTGRVKTALVADMVGYHKRDFKVLVEGTLRYRSLVSQVMNALTTWSELGVDKTYHSWGSDHVSFQNAGIPAVLVIETEFESNATYHTTDDTFDLVDPEMGTEATRGLIAELATLAGLLPPA